MFELIWAFCFNGMGTHSRGAEGKSVRTDFIPSINLGVELITDVTHMRNVRKNIYIYFFFFCNKEIRTNMKYFALLP